MLPTGQVIYSRWDYTGVMHLYLRPLMVMNPDGTLQHAVYGSNSYYPNALYFPRGVPDAPNKLVAILSGYHGVNRAGEMVPVERLYRSLPDPLARPDGAHGRPA